MSTAIKRNSMFPSVFSDFFENDRFFNTPWFEKEFGQTMPAVNIKETEIDFDIQFAVPGYEKKDFNVKVENDTLTISAEKRDEKNEENKRYTRREFSYNSFSRSFNLPQSVNADKIDARYTDGILQLLIPKKEENKVPVKKEIKIS